MDVTETPPIVVTTAEAWTPLENAERSGDGARRDAANAIGFGSTSSGSIDDAG